MIAREGAPGAVGTVQTRRQANDQEPRISYAKGWHRPAVIVGVPALDVVKESREPRTIAARFIKDRFVHASILHVADDGPSETSRTNQASARNQLLKLLLDFLLVVRLRFTLGRSNSGT